MVAILTVQRTQTLTLAFLVTALLGAWALLMPMQASAQSPDPVPDAGLRDAIEKHIESKGLTYAGLCREIEQWNHHGETCAFVLSIQDGRAEISYGAVASDEIQRASFTLSNGAWVAMDEAEPTPELPTTDITQDLKDAIRDFIEGRGLTYAGLCTEIEQWLHYGEYCAMVEMDGDNKARVTYGVVATDALQSETFVRDSTGWHAESSGPIVPPVTETPVNETPDTETPVPATPTSTPTTDDKPATPENPTSTPGNGDGSDDNDDDSSDNTVALLIAVFGGTALLGGIGGYSFFRRRS